MMHPLSWSSSSRRRAEHLSENRLLPLAPALIARAPFAPLATSGEGSAVPLAIQPPPASQLSEHPALPLCPSTFPLARSFALLSAHFLARETMALFAWNIRDLHRYSVFLAAAEDMHLVRNLMQIVFAFLAPKTKKAINGPFSSIQVAGRGDSNPRPPA